MNVLPDDAKQNLRAERFSRFLIVSSAVLSMILWIGGILLLVPWFALTLEGRELEKHLETVKQSPSLPRVDAIENMLSSLNKKLDAYGKNHADIVFASPLIDILLDHKESGISFSVLSYHGIQGQQTTPQLRAEGSARDRTTLLALRDSLEQDPCIEHVRVPISDLLKETNIKFSITFDMNASCIGAHDAP